MSEFFEQVDLENEDKLPDRTTLINFSPAKSSPFGRYLGLPTERQRPHVPFPVHKRFGLSEEAFEALLISEIDEVLAAPAEDRL
jgi:hypothetical protein